MIWSTYGIKNELRFGSLFITCSHDRRRWGRQVELREHRILLKLYATGRLASIQKAVGRESQSFVFSNCRDGPAKNSSNVNRISWGQFVHTSTNSGNLEVTIGHNSSGPKSLLGLVTIGHNSCSLIGVSNIHLVFVRLPYTELEGCGLCVSLAIELYPYMLLRQHPIIPSNFELNENLLCPLGIFFFLFRSWNFA